MFLKFKENGANLHGMPTASRALNRLSGATGGNGLTGRQ
jgi:hypothetical protein